MIYIHYKLFDLIKPPHPNSSYSFTLSINIYFLVVLLVFSLLQYKVDFIEYLNGMLSDQNKMNRKKLNQIGDIFEVKRNKNKRNVEKIVVNSLN